MMLEARQLRIEQGGRVLIDSLDLTMRRGEFWCVLGRNGCGKTTLLLTLAGLRAPAAGEVWLDGRRLDAWSWPELARRRGLLPQRCDDAFAHSVFESVLAGTSPHGSGLWGWADQTAKEQVRCLLQELKLDAFAQRDVRTLSGGERQRVALATLLAQRTDLALADEPTAHLDIDVQHEVMKLLAQRVAQGGLPTAAIVAVHDLNLALRYASHVILFADNGQVFSGASGDVLTIENLAKVYRQPLRMIEANGERWMVPA